MLRDGRHADAQGTGIVPARRQSPTGVRVQRTRRRKNDAAPSEISNSRGSGANVLDASRWPASSGGWRCAHCRGRRCRCRWPGQGREQRAARVADVERRALDERHGGMDIHSPPEMSADEYRGGLSPLVQEGSAMRGPCRDAGIHVASQAGRSCRAVMLPPRGVQCPVPAPASPAVSRVMPGSCARHGRGRAGARARAAMGARPSFVYCTRSLPGILIALPAPSPRRGRPAAAGGP